MKKSIVILGPTASGKTNLSLEMAKKQNLNIVNSDSRQFWKEIKHLSCSPSEKNKQEVGHFLFNTMDSDIKPNLGWWADEISKIDNKLIVGGNSFYIQSLQNGIPKNVIISEETRRKMQEIPNQWQFLKDNNLNIKFHANDKYRTERKLEFFLETGYDFDDYPEKYKEELYIIILNPSLETLKENIEKRTEFFIDLAIEEVRNSSKHENFLNIIGFQEICQFLNKEIDKSNLISEINRKTLKYAKHQRKFLKKIQAKEILIV